MLPGLEVILQPLWMSLVSFSGPFKFHSYYVVMKECSMMLRTFANHVRCYNKCIIVAVDAFTRVVELKACRDATAKSAARLAVIVQLMSIMEVEAKTTLPYSLKRLTKPNKIGVL